MQRLTQALGSDLFARVDRRGPVLLTPDWFDQRMMEWSMADEAVKVQFFRFIDALPQLSTSVQICRHLREYFEEARRALPGWAVFGTKCIPRNGLLADLLARLARTNAQRLARRFIAGSNVEEALKSIADMRRRKMTFTVDLLGEATITEAEAEHYQAQYLELFEGLCSRVNSWPAVEQIDRDASGPLPRVNVSVKLSSLYSQFDPIDQVGTSRAVRDRLRPILRLARQRGAFVNFDMEQYASRT